MRHPNGWFYFWNSENRMTADKRFTDGQVRKPHLANDFEDSEIYVELRKTTDSQHQYVYSLIDHEKQYVYPPENPRLLAKIAAPMTRRHFTSNMSVYDELQARRTYWKHIKNHPTHLLDSELWYKYEYYFSQAQVEALSYLIWCSVGTTTSMKCVFVLLMTFMDAEALAPSPCPTTPFSLEQAKDFIEILKTQMLDPDSPKARMLHPYPPARMPQMLDSDSPMMTDRIVSVLTVARILSKKCLFQLQC
jgi:hypothetical protein